MSDSDSELETRILDSFVQDKPNNQDIILNKEGIEKKIAEIDYRLQLGMKHIPFVEVLSVTDRTAYNEKVDYKDSTSRESYFYENTLRNVKEGCKILKNNNLNWNRPDDMLAEMLKTDQHMRKIKLDLLKQEQKIKAIEMKKQKYIEKKFTRKIQVEKKKKKKQEIKKNLKEIECWKRSDHTSSNSIEESFDKYFSDKKASENKVNKNKRKKKVAKKRLKN